MKQTIEFKGYWFTPENPHNRVAGILTYIPNEKIKLELIGAFETPHEYVKTRVSGNKNHPLIIHGETSSARKVTLINCRPAAASLNFSCSFAMQSYIVQYVLDGIYINDFKEQVFDKISLSLPHLTTWVNHYSLDHSITYNENGPRAFNLGYDLDNAHLITVDIDDNLTVEIEYICSTADKYNEEVVIKQSHQLNIMAKKPIDFSHFLILANKFRDFLSMGTLEAIDYQSIQIYSPDLFQELKSTRKIYLPINLFFKQELVNYKQTKFSEFLFDYQAVSANFKHALKTWYSFDDTMLPIMQHLIESIQPKTYFTKADFLIVIQALEGFHTRFRDKGKITLKDRLVQLHQEFSFISSIKQHEIDYKTAIDSRHYYSHFFNKSQKPHIADGLELYNITLALKKILICCVLKETGFDDDTINSIMEKETKIV